MLARALRIAAEELKKSETYLYIQLAAHENVKESGKNIAYFPLLGVADFLDSFSDVADDEETGIAIAIHSKEGFHYVRTTFTTHPLVGSLV